ncbi:hypothetical protein GQ600_5667 [Phytophthora cactorum]|nr:hypothetical protein GQ600_5667 [Phytophthora cactorum]
MNEALDGVQVSQTPDVPVTFISASTIPPLSHGRTSSLRGTRVPNLVSDRVVPFAAIPSWQFSTVSGYEFPIAHRTFACYSRHQPPRLTSSPESTGLARPPRGMFFQPLDG